MTERWRRFADEAEFVERECLLFEAGAYPDKGVTITLDDLKAIAANSDAAIPVRIEHLAESPFDAALGVMTRLRAVGSQLWGTLRQPVEAWRLAQKAGAKALSVGLDVANRRIIETSFVRHPRIAGAQVFGAIANVAIVSTPIHFTTGVLFNDSAETRTGRSGMTAVRQFAEGLMAYLRGAVGSLDDRPEPDEASTAAFAETRAQLERERQAMRVERAETQILEWKRQGRLRATERTEALARILLTGGENSLVVFDGDSVPIATLFAQFVRENGPVVPMGEQIVADRQSAINGGAASASAKLALLASEKARQDGLTYVQSFALVTAAHPDLARASRDE